MEITKISERVDALENESNDESEETKSVGAVNIEFTGEFVDQIWTLEIIPNTIVLKQPFSGLSDLIHSRSYNPSYGNGQPLNGNFDSEIKQKLTKEGLRFASMFVKCSFIHKPQLVIVS